jgi:transcriptional regulator with XRE-family HTH domain
MKNLTDLMNALPPERRARVEDRAAALIAEEMTLRDLRKARDLTQVRMAELLGVGQDNISRLESRADMLLSTLRSYVDAMGGSLDLLVRFPDRPTVSLSDLFGTDKTTTRRASAAAAKRKRKPALTR